jgi:hypothetical protein
MTDTQIEIREIKATLKSMQADIERLKDSIPTYQYSPECVPQKGSYEWITNWVNYSTQGCCQEELLK